MPHDHKKKPKHPATIPNQPAPNANKGPKLGDPTTPKAPGTQPTPQKPAELADPTLRTKHQNESYGYQRFKGKPIINGVSAEDVVQGQVADCYFVSALSAVASGQPGLIAKGIRDKGNGAYSVRFFRRKGYGSATYDEVWIDVDADLPSMKGGSRTNYARSGDSDQDGMELWPSLYEKAYAVWKGGYDKMGEGGVPGDALEALTGKSTSYTSASASTPGGAKDDPLWARLKAAADKKAPTTAGTYGEDKKAMYEGKRLYPWHAYTVVGVKEKDGKRFVVLRNPWGSSEPGADGKDDGIFDLELSEFKTFYQGVTITNL